MFGLALRINVFQFLNLDVTANTPRVAFYAETHNCLQCTLSPNGFSPELSFSDDYNFVVLAREMEREIISLFALRGNNRKRSSPSRGGISCRHVATKKMSCTRTLSPCSFFQGRVCVSAEDGYHIRAGLAFKAFSRPSKVSLVYHALYAHK